MFGVLMQEGLGGANQATLFRRVNRCQPRQPSAGTAKANLDEHQRVAFQHDQVDLPGAAGEVPRHRPHAAALQ